MLIKLSPGLRRVFEDVLVSYIKNEMKENTKNAIREAIKSRDQRELEVLVSVAADRGEHDSAFELRDKTED